MTNQGKFNLAKEKMKAYRGFFGEELIRKDLIDDAKNIFDLEYIINEHFSYIEQMASDAESNLSKFKNSLDLF